MPKFIVWYKKEIYAKDVKKAVQAEAKIKPSFHSIEEQKDATNELTPCIGFEYTPYEEEY